MKLLQTIIPLALLQASSSSVEKETQRDFDVVIIHKGLLI